MTKKKSKEGPVASDVQPPTPANGPAGPSDSTSQPRARKLPTGRAFGRGLNSGAYSTGTAPTQPRRAVMFDHFVQHVAPKLGLDPATWAAGLGPEATEETRKAVFIEMYREFGNWRPGCRAAGVDRPTVRRWREDPEFVQRMDDAFHDCIDAVEVEAWRRATEGNVTTIDTVLERESDEKGYTREESSKTTREYSDNLIVTLLKANRDKYNTSKQEITGPQGGPIQIQRVERVIVDPTTAPLEQKA